MWTLDLPQLKTILIGYNCFTNVREFVIDGLASLESVKISKYCFRMGNEKRDDGICRITNCPNLRQLEIDNGSFGDFRSFKLSNVNSLQSIQFGWGCFKYAEEFSLKGEWERGRDVIVIVILIVICEWCWIEWMMMF